MTSNQVDESVFSDANVCERAENMNVTARNDAHRDGRRDGRERNVRIGEYDARLRGVLNRVLRLAALRISQQTPSR